LPLKAAFAVIGIGCMVAAVFMAYQHGLRELGRSEAQHEQVRQQLDADLQRARSEMEELEERNLELTESLAKADRQLQVDGMAYKELARGVAVSTEQVAALSQELEFYRNIVSPPSGRSGLQIQNLDVQRTTEDGEYRYTIVLIQSLHHSEEIKGTVELEIQGSQEGKKKIVHLPEGDKDVIEVSFKYFQNLDGYFVLPDGYMPTGIKISISTDVANAPTIERWYPWPAV